MADTNGTITLKERDGPPDDAPAGMYRLYAQDDDTLRYIDDTGQVFTIATGGASSVFGNEYQSQESLGQSTTTSTTFQDKIDWTTTSLPAGTYRVGWSFGWSHGATNTDFESRIQRNGTTVMSHMQEPQDSGTDQFHRECGFFTFTIGAAATQDLNLQFRTDDSDDTAYIRDARLELWRVS